MGGTSLSRETKGGASPSRVPPKGIDLTPANSYNALFTYGSPNLRDLVRQRYAESRSVPMVGTALNSPLLAHLRKGHQDVKLDADALDRLITWIDTYGQRQGHFSPDQEQQLRELRARLAGLLAAGAGK